MASGKLIDFHCRLWLLLSCMIQAKCASNLENDSSEGSYEDNLLERIHFDDQLHVFLLPFNFELDRMVSHKHSLAA